MDDKGPPKEVAVNANRGLAQTKSRPGMDNTTNQPRVTLAKQCRATIFSHGRQGAKGRRQVERSRKSKV
jgi:hypothetical protein